VKSVRNFFSTGPRPNFRCVTVFERFLGQTPAVGAPKDLSEPLLIIFCCPRPASYCVKKTAIIIGCADLKLSVFFPTNLFSGGNLQS
jgi:hypothetical protein